MAKIIPIFKAEDNTNNYRPISLLSNFNRIFEKLVFSIEWNLSLSYTIPISIWIPQSAFNSACNECRIY